MSAIDAISIGQRFGSKTVAGFVTGPRNVRMCIVRCDCGRECRAWASELLAGLGRQCNVCRGQALAATSPRLRHGHKRAAAATAEYRTWCKARERCEVPAAPGYADYGGRGIRMCERWRDSFDAFLADMGARPTSGHSIDRIDNGRGYEPGNCRWATRREQAMNKRTTLRVEIGGESKPLLEWAEMHGVVTYKLAWQRLRKGWDPLAAVSTPAGPTARRYR